MGDVHDAKEAWDLGEDDYEHLAPTLVMEYVKLGKGDYGSDPSVRTCAWTHAWLHMNTEVDTVFLCRRQKGWFRDWALDSSSPVTKTLGASASSPIESQRH